MNDEPKRSSFGHVAIRRVIRKRPNENGSTTPNAMTIGIAASLILSAGLIWLGPETRGRNFSETECPRAYFQFKPKG
jgi:hypothetical protein